MNTYCDILPLRSMNQQQKHSVVTMGSPKNRKDSAGMRFAIDTMVATLAGFSLAWYITPMDTAVIRNMRGTMNIPQSLKESFSIIFTKPHQYLMRPEYNIVFVTYGSTYLSKNYIDSACYITNQNPETTAMYKFWVVLLVNGGLSVFWKDPKLAILFGNQTKNASQTAKHAMVWFLVFIFFSFFFWSLVLSVVFFICEKGTFFYFFCLFCEIAHFL